jgi:hypothetical protein
LACVVVIGAVDADVPAASAGAANRLAATRAAATCFNMADILSGVAVLLNLDRCRWRPDLPGKMAPRG